MLGSRATYQHKNLTQAFRALGDETRMHIIRLLAENKGICVGEIAAKLGMSDSAVSQHCRILQEAGLIHPEREGLKKCYRLQQDDETMEEILSIALSETK